MQFVLCKAQHKFKFYFHNQNGQQIGGCLSPFQDFNEHESFENNLKLENLTIGCQIEVCEQMKSKIEEKNCWKENFVYV